MYRYMMNMCMTIIIYMCIAHPCMLPNETNIQKLIINIYINMCWRDLMYKVNSKNVLFIVFFLLQNVIVSRLFFSFLRFLDGFNFKVQLESRYTLGQRFVLCHIISYLNVSCWFFFINFVLSSLQVKKNCI